MSFLQPPAAVRSLIEEAGLTTEEFRDGTATACEWCHERLSGAATAPPPLGLHLLVGPDSPAVFRNVLRNYAEGRTVVIQAVCRKQ